MRDPDDFALSGPVRAGGFVFLWLCAGALQRAANACLATAAGLLRQGDMRTISQAHWQQLATSPDDIDAGLKAWERRLYEDLFSPSDRVLLVGCGTGRDLLALREQGYDVTGLDTTPGITDLARQHLARRGLTAPVMTGFVETIELDERYDVVVLAGCCYSYVPGSDSRVATLKRIRDRLSERGRVAITYEPLGRPTPASISLTQFSARLTRADWRPARGDSFTRSYLVKRALRYEHGFGPGEVARECAEAGLRVVQDESENEMPWVLATP